MSIFLYETFPWTGYYCLVLACRQRCPPARTLSSKQPGGRKKYCTLRTSTCTVLLQYQPFHVLLPRGNTRSNVEVIYVVRCACWTPRHEGKNGAKRLEPSLRHSDNLYSTLVEYFALHLLNCLLFSAVFGSRKHQLAACRTEVEFTSLSVGLLCG